MLDQQRWAHRQHWSRRCVLLLGALCCSGVLSGTAPADAIPVTGSKGPIYQATLAYVEHFYPRWLSYEQDLKLRPNMLVAPQEMTPDIRVIVAPNDDTLYAASLMDLTKQAVILTVPRTTATYSLFSADSFGDVLPTSLPAEMAGTYALTGPGWSGTLPTGVARVPLTQPLSLFLVRIDRDSAPSDVVTAFRAGLRLEPLSDYLTDPTGGATQVLPMNFFSTSYKVLADAAATKAPMQFLRQLQTGMELSTTPRLDGPDQAVADRFNALFGNGGASLRLSAQFEAEAAVREAHARIVSNYRTHTDSSHWISFPNIGDWGPQYLDRSSIAEFIQYGNLRSVAAYYQAFTDAGGSALDASTGGYVLTFPKNDVPQARRFWSVTAYLPGSITLVPNSFSKYVVASYTPGLSTNADGSLSIYMTPTRPKGVPSANWLPVPHGPFSVMLRVYGPMGSIATNTYTPPGIAPWH